MIRIYQTQLVTVEGTGETLERSEIYCNSTDTKPTTGLVNGSTLTEVDTGKTYLFDESNAAWTEVSAGGGGGGSNLIVKLSYDELTQTYTFDKTLNEILVAAPNVVLTDSLVVYPLVRYVTDEGLESVMFEQRIFDYVSPNMICEIITISFDSNGVEYIDNGYSWTATQL